MHQYPMDSIIIFDEDGNPQFDRASGTPELRRLYKTLYGEGVLPEDTPGAGEHLKVKAAGGMTVTVEPGFILVNGCMAEETEVRELQIEAADGQDRIDSVIVRLNDSVNVRTVDFYIKRGTPASVPEAPELIHNDTFYELGIANLFIPKNNTAITQQRITDTRYTKERCGVLSPLGKLDTTGIYDQIQADMAFFKENEQANFMDWFDHIKGQLDEDAAGHLQNEIDILKQDVEDGFADFEQKISTSVGQNLVPYPYMSMDAPMFVAFLVQNDGSLTLNGRVPEGVPDQDYIMGTVDLKGNTSYTLQLFSTNHDETYSAVINNSDGVTLIASAGGNEKTTFTLDSDMTVYFYIRIKGGTEDLTGDNLRFMLEEGTIAHAYQNPAMANSNLAKEVAGKMDKSPFLKALWTNPKGVTEEFANQTITLPFNNYTWYLIECNYGNQTGRYHTIETIVKRGKAFVINCISANTSQNLASRSSKVSNQVTVVFEDAYCNGVLDNRFIIPRAIYGII